MRRQIFDRILALSVVLIALGCSSTEEIRSADPAAAAPGTQESDWITVFDPTRAWKGYTLAFVSQSTPILMDMNGRVLHRWPDARVKTRVRLLEDGSILGIALGRGLVEYDWEGNLVWQFEADYGFAHHDVIRLDNGNTMTLIRPDAGGFDDIVEADPSGAIVWEWRGADHLRPWVPGEHLQRPDITHMNSLQELPENRWFDLGDERFRPGNILTSARDLDLVFIIDRQTGEVVWTFGTDLQKQHEPQMLEKGRPDAGRILIYNNRYRSFYLDRQSAILAINPISGRALWQYRSAGFLSPTSGVQQHLPNGNVLITSTRGGRTFEITPAGRLVWEWAPPFDPMRSHRYSYDHTPQLAALEPPTETRIEPPDGYRYIDDDVFRFAQRGLLREVFIDGKKIKGILKYSNDCRKLVVPVGPSLLLQYGVDKQGAIEAGYEGYAADFRVTVGRVGSEEPLEVFHDRVDLTGETWRHRNLDLSPHALQHVELCLELAQTGLPRSQSDTELAYWRRPVIRPARADRTLLEQQDAPVDDLTPEELDARKKHLEALGYIN